MFKYKVLLILNIFLSLQISAENIVLSPVEMDWIVKTSPSTQDVLDKYYKKFKYEKLKSFAHADILSAGGDKDDESSYNFDIPTTDGVKQSRLIQGDLAVGIQGLFLLTHGFELPTYSSVEPDFEFKDTTVGSYLEFENFSILGSVIFKSYQKTKIINGVSFFDVSTEENTINSTQIYIQGDINIFNLGISYDSFNGLEKLFLEYNLHTINYGNYNFRLIDGYLPVKYDDLKFHYENKINKHYKLSISSKYRIYRDSMEVYQNGFVNNELGIDINIKKAFNIILSVSNNKEYTQDQVAGYSALFKLGTDFGKQKIDYFFGWSKNNSKYLSRVPIQDIQLFNIGLTLSRY